MSALCTLMILFLAVVHTLYMVQTEDNTLHFLRNGRRTSIPLASLVKRPLGIMDEERHSGCEELVKRHDEIVDGVRITTDGNVVVKGLSFPIDSITDRPLIYFNTVFKAERRYHTSRLYDVVVFVATLRVTVIDLETMYTRNLIYPYVYHPFESRKELPISDYYFRDGEDLHSFDTKILCVYESEEYQGNLYMSKIYSNDEVLVYRHPRRVKERRWLSTLLVSVLAASVLGLSFHLVRKNSIMPTVSRKVWETKGYEVYEGVFRREPVLVKMYRRRDTRGPTEVRLLRELSHPNISRLIFEEVTFFKHVLIFEHSERFFSNDRKQLKQIVDAIVFLHSKGIHHGGLCPDSIRVRGHSVFVSNFEDTEGDCNRDIGVLGWRSMDIIRHNLVGLSLDREMFRKSDVFSLGLLLHYYLTGHHPFEVPGDCTGHIQDEDTGSHDLPGGREINLKEAEANVVISKYTIRVTDPIEHDIIHRSIGTRYFERPEAEELASHPFFWSDRKIFNFIANLSDIVERTPGVGRTLENNRHRIFEEPWNTHLDQVVKQDLLTFRLYNFNRVRDLLRVIRNKGRHYNELPDSVKSFYNGYVSGFTQYWLKKFPSLLLVCYQCGKRFSREELLQDFYPRIPCHTP